MSWHKSDLHMRGGCVCCERAETIPCTRKVCRQRLLTAWPVSAVLGGSVDAALVRQLWPRPPTAGETPAA